MKLKIRSLFILLMISVYSSENWACKMSRDPKNNFFIDYVRSYIGNYGDGNASILPSSINECRLNAGKYLMLSSGVRIPARSSDVSEISFDGQMAENSCRVENSLFANMPTYDQRKFDVQEQHRFLRTCTFIDVADTTGRPVRFKENQSSCQLTVISPGVVRMKGNFCFLQIDPSYNLSVTLGIDDNCAKEQFLKENNIAIRDYEVSLNSYVVGDDTGQSTDIDAIGSRRYRLTIQPDEKILKLSDDLGQESPRFPTEYSAEIHIGNIEIAPMISNRSMINLSYSVANRAQPKCSDGLCSNIANYHIPIVSDVNIYEIAQNNKKILIDSWMTAGVAEANWQGILKSTQHPVDDFVFEIGKTYTIISDFVDPYDDYQLYLKYTQQMLIDLKGANGVAGLEQLSPLLPLDELEGIPNMNGLPAMTSTDLNTDLDRALKFFKMLGSDRNWPIYYEKVCSPEILSCVQSGKAKYWLKLTTTFTVTGKDPNSNKLILSNFRLRKETPQHLFYDKNIDGLPKYLCQ